ncbi:MAG: oligoendopeptidase F [Clostridia bacterium]|nr:oligoendopeptidase F [Clostridia bacterium]
MAKLPARSEIDPKYRWNLSHIFATEEDWEAALKACEARVADIAAMEGRVADDPAAAIRANFDIQDEVMPVIEYAFLSREGDNGDPKAQSMFMRVMGLITKLSAAGAYLEPELLELDDSVLEGLRADPAMADYDEYIRTLMRRKPHTLPKEQERLLASLGEVLQAPDQIYSGFTAVDLHFPDMELPDGTKEPLTDGTWGPYRESSDREIRKQSFEKIMKGYGAYGTTIAATYAASVKKDCAIAAARRYPDALAAAMDPLEIPREVYDNLIAVIHESLPILQDYLRLRKKILGVDELHMYDLYCPLIADYEMKLPYEKAFDLVLEGLKPMGEDYLAKLREARDNGWIDVFPAQGKSSGAFSSGSLRHVHPYVLLNHNDNLDSAFTIAHELGHSMHSFYSNTNQPLPKAEYSLFVAEVASTCNEAVMLRHLLKEFPEPKAQAYLLNHFLEQLRTTCFRQTMFAEFERISHEMAANGVPLTRETLSEAYYKLNETYYGGSCTVDEWIADEWMRIPHFYRAFYVYVYATGLCAAVTLSERILSEGEAAVRDVRKFLSAGCSVPPIEALKLAGVDMSSPEPIRKAMGVFRETLTAFEQAVAKLEEA